MKILFIGDVFGKCGRKALCDLVPVFKQKYQIDLVIANAENVSNGKGLKKEHYLQLKNAGVDYFTMGNHTWDNDEVYDLFLNYHDVIRPGNINLLVDSDYAQYSVLFVKNGLKIRLTNLIGGNLASKHFTATSPFLFMQDFLKRLKSNYEQEDLHLIDFHAEYTAEKAAMLHSLDGQVSAVFGTHTHVQSNDAMITKNGTAFITDAGLTGASDSIIGAKIKPLVDFYNGISDKKYISSGVGPYQFCAVYLFVDEEQKKITKIKTIFYHENEPTDFSYLND